jgi:N-acetylglutamate synthase-like GNAT family acetyltransferase
MPATGDTYYIHDLALLRHARSGGQGSAIVRWLIANARKAGFSSLSLVAVSGSGAFWERHGFRVVRDDELANALASYGTDARYMVRAT